jgi:hypothetical protein
MFSIVNLDFNLEEINSFSSSDKDCEAFKSKVKTTLDETLFTFCPPAPELLTALKVTSDMIFSLSIICHKGAKALSFLSK